VEQLLAARCNIYLQTRGSVTALQLASTAAHAAIATMIRNAAIATLKQKGAKDAKVKKQQEDAAGTKQYTVRGLEPLLSTFGPCICCLDAYHQTRASTTTRNTLFAQTSAFAYACCNACIRAHAKPLAYACYSIFPGISSLGTGTADRAGKQ